MKSIIALDALRRPAAALAVALAAATLAAPALAACPTSRAPNQSPYGVRVLPWCEPGQDADKASNDGAVYFRKAQDRQPAAQAASAQPFTGAPNSSPNGIRAPLNHEIGPR